MICYTRNFVVIFLLLRSIVAMDFQFLINNRTMNPMDFVIPTVNSKNVLCANHSMLYKSELTKYTLWAIDMFDSTTKFPSGISSGSIHDTGNFDGCISVHLPESMGFSGQHCMAHFIMSSFSTNNATYSNEYEKVYNLTFWDKSAIFDADPRKKSRRDIYMSFCIPSSCTYTDLQNGLLQNIENVNLPFVLDVSVDEKNCQTETAWTYTYGDKIFLGIVIFIILFELTCTSYHLLTKLECVKHLKSPGKVYEIIKAFSFSHTIKKLTKIPHKENGLEFMDGIKVISTVLVIMGHRVSFSTTSPIGNPVFIEKSYEDLQYSFILMGPIIVDNFFTISGFLACYYMLCELEKSKGKANLMFAYFHRIVRFAPSYAVVIGFYMTIFVHLGSGPFWREKIELEKEHCIENWWTNLLYINNYVNVEKICLFHTWYLSCDMQLFIFVPFLAYILWKKPKTGIICCIALTIGSIIIHFMVIYYNEEVPFLLLYIDSRFSRHPVNTPGYRNVHIPGHMRASPYFVGVLTAYFKFKYKKTKYEIHNWIKNLCWLIFVAISSSLFIFGMHFYSPSEEKNFIIRGLFGTSLHFFWGIAMSWCVIAISESRDQLLARILTGKIWTILSKLTLTTYLCHTTIQLYSVGILRYPNYAGLFSLYYHAAADTVSAYLVGFFVSIVFEGPIMELEKILLRKDLPKSVHNNIELTERPEDTLSVSNEN